MQTLREWTERTLGLTAAAQEKLLFSLLVVLVLWLLRRVVLRVVARSTEDIRGRYQWQKSSAYVASLLGMLLVGRIWFEGFQSLATYLGLLSAGVAIALKDLLVNLAGWVFLVWRRPFEVGDRIQIGGHSGDVIDLRIFQFTLLEIGNWVDADQSTGRMIHIPNGKVFTDPLANYSQGFQYIWNEMPVLVTFESNWRKAKEILEQVVTRHAGHVAAEADQQVRAAARKFMIFYTTVSPTVYTSVKDSGFYTGVAPR